MVSLQRSWAWNISGEIAEITKRTYNCICISTFLQAAGIRDGNFQRAQLYVQKGGWFHYYDQCGGSGMRIRDVYPRSRIPDVYPRSRILIFTHPWSRIPDLGSKNSNKREGWKKFFVIPFYVATNFTKLEIILVLKCWRKKFGPIFKEL